MRQRCLTMNNDYNNAAGSAPSQWKNWAQRAAKQRQNRESALENAFCDGTKVAIVAWKRLLSSQSSAVHLQAPSRTD